MPDPTVNVENVSVEAKAATSLRHTVEHTEASILPEIDWGWRRFFIWFVTFAATALVYWITWRVQDVTTLRMIARYALLGVGFFSMLYITGASAEQVVRLVQAAKTTRKETTTEEPK